MTGQEIPAVPSLEEQVSTLKAELAEAYLKATDAQAAQAVAEAKLEELRAENGVVVRYAVFDTRYDKFVGDVSTKKPPLPAAKKLVGHDDVEVREV